MAVRTRIWLNSPDHNYNDKRKIEINESDPRVQVLYEETNTHFNYGDFINASCVTIAPVAVLNNQPNYLILKNDDEIESRWYVTNLQFISGEVSGNKSKFIVTLLRDVIVDYKDILATSTVKVRRGNLPDIWNPALIQSENIALNEVKVQQRDIKLWDNDTRWLTIFYDSKPEVIDNAGPIEYDNSKFVSNVLSLTTMQSEFASKGLTLLSDGLSNFTYKRNWISQKATLDIEGWKQTISGLDNMGKFGEIDVTIDQLGNMTYVTRQTYFPEGNNSYVINCINSVASKMSGLNAGYFSDLVNTNNTQWLINNSDYVDLRNKWDGAQVLSGTTINRANFSSQVSSNTTTPIVNLLTYLGSFADATPPDNRYGNETGGKAYAQRNTEVQLSTDAWSVGFTYLMVDGNIRTRKLALPKSTTLDEIAVGCLAIPFGTNTRVKVNNQFYTFDNDDIKSLITSGFTLAGNVIKDVQILPYCPVAELNSYYYNATQSDDIQLDIPQFTGSGSFRLVPIKDTTSGESTIYYGVVAITSSADYRYPIDISDLYNGTDIKFKSITQKLRLMNPDHRAAFEFTPASGNGLNYLSLSYTLRPFKTAYRIVPVFNEDSLYGGNYKDSRGLIWEGGMSISQVSDTWVNYQLQNSTYNQVFSTEVAHLESTANRQASVAENSMLNAYNNAMLSASNSYSNAQANAALAMIGGIAGIATGNPTAMVGGALAMGGGLNALHSASRNNATANQIASNNLEASQYAMNVNKQQAAADIQLKSDLLALNTQAIKAQPSTISKISEITVISNLKAYIEVYECTVEEKALVRKYLQWNGIAINRIGYLNSYIQNDGDYIEATIINLGSLTPTILQALNSELSKGMYVQKDLFRQGEST